MKSIISQKIVFLFRTLSILNFPYVNSFIYTECGGSFSNTSSIISYKHGELIAPYERCVYSIRVARSVTYQLVVNYYGLESSSQEHGLSTLCISSKGGKDVTLSQLKIEGTGVVKLDENCTILILTYYTGPNIGNSKGFTLAYKSVSGGAPYYSSESKHCIFNESFTYTPHPQKKFEESYKNNELSTFIYLPQDNLYNPHRKTVITYFKDRLEEGCFDKLWVYSFRKSDGMWVSSSNSSGRFVSPYTLCLETSAFIKSEDVIMLIFRSDASYNYAGFRLVQYYQCCYK